MKTKHTRPWLTAAALVTAAVLSPHPAAAQKTAKEAEKPQTGDYSALLRGPKHDALNQFEGTWQTTLRIWGHGTPPPENKMDQTVTARWILRNNWLQTDFIQTFVSMPAPDNRFTGHVFRGYNGATENYVALLMSDGDVRETVSTGTYDPEKKQFVFIGPEKDPVTQDTFQRKEIYTFLDADNYKYELIYVYLDNTESRAAEGIFTRVKDKK